MKTLFAFLLGILIGAGGMWLYQIAHDETARKEVEEKVTIGADRLKETLNESIDAGAETIKEEMTRTGDALRRKVDEIMPEPRNATNQTTNAVGTNERPRQPATP